ncbi:hypothetical protein BH24PSE2_BH24PSE2_02630 [soil metagenome]
MTAAPSISGRLCRAALLGLQRDIRPDGTVLVEFIKVHDTPDGIPFTVIPLGQEQTDFELVSSAGTRAVFESRAHNFPNRITFWLENSDILAAGIEGRAGQPSAEWRWKRVAPGFDVERRKDVRSHQHRLTKGV